MLYYFRFFLGLQIKLLSFKNLHTFFSQNLVIKFKLRIFFNELAKLNKLFKNYVLTFIVVSKSISSALKAFSINRVQSIKDLLSAANSNILNLMN